MHNISSSHHHSGLGLPRRYCLLLGGGEGHAGGDTLGAEDAREVLGGLGELLLLLTRIDKHLRVLHVEAIPAARAAMGAARAVLKDNAGELLMAGAVGHGAA